MITICKYHILNHDNVSVYHCIPRGRRKNCVPCWDKACETIYRSFTRAPVGTDSDRIASSLLSWLEQKKQEWWEEAVNFIDFSHSSRKAWRTINKLASRSGGSFRQYSVLANSITWQLVKNGTHKTGDRECTRLVNKGLSDLWKIPTPEGHSSGVGGGGESAPQKFWSGENLSKIPKNPWKSGQTLWKYRQK